MKKREIIKLFVYHILSLAIILSIVLPLTDVSVFADDDDEGYVPRDKCTDEDVKKQETDDEDKKDKKKEDDKSDIGEANGDGGWLEKGTKKNKDAQKVYDVFTEDYGTSGAFAIGAMVNVQRESKFERDVKEIEGGQNYAGRGGGLFQFTPKEKFTNSKQAKKGDDKWAVENQIAYLWDSEFKGKQIEAYLEMNDAPDKKVEDLISEDDPEKATEGFYKGYERGRDAESDIAKSKGFVKQAEKVFNKDDPKADKSKWKFAGDSKKEVKTSSQKEDSKDKESDDDNKDSDMKDCSSDVKKKKKDERDDSLASWGDDGKGKHSQKLNDGQKMFKRDDLPKELKKYALDPAKVGMGWKNKKGWKGGGFDTDGQCTNLSSSMFGNTWKKDGEKPRWDDLQNTGNGDQTASSFADMYGGKTSDKPSKGAVFSAKPGSKMGPTHFGHTGIVSHVFENGDVLLTEQNIPGYSGDEDNNPMTWNYRLISKDLAGTMEYYSPEKEGYKPDKAFK